MKKFLLPLVVALISLASCTDYTDDFNTINNRLDALEQAVPSIEEQIESINTQLTSLKATDEAIKEQIAELEKSDKATATEIADLKKKDSALEKSINDLQKYVDTQIANAKSEAAAAYATVEQYNTIVAQLNALQGSTSKLGEELTAKINAEVKSLNDRIADLEARLKAVEDKVENLLARIQSVSYIPTYNDNKATLKYISGASQVVLDFKVSPKECVAELEKVWESAVKIDAVYTETRAVSFVDMPIISFEADVTNGIISVTASGENLSDELFAGTQSASVALAISDGNSSVTSEYVPMVVKEITDEIWYTSTDGKIVEPTSTDGWGANIISNTYKNGIGIIKFDKNVTIIPYHAYKSTHKLASIYIPNSVSNIEENAFSYCTNLNNVYGKFTSSDNKCIIVDNKLITLCPKISGEYTIPKEVTSLGFLCITSLRDKIELTIPENVSHFNKNGIMTILVGVSSFKGPYATSDGKFLVKDNELYGVAGYDLTHCIIPDGITSIKQYLFQSLAINQITIPETIVNMGLCTFSNCNRLRNVYCKAKTPPTAKSIFSNLSTIPTIHVPTASVEEYKSANYWRNHADYIVGYDF